MTNPGLRSASELSSTPSRLAAWILAVRPRTLSLSLSPVLVGAAIAYATTERLNWLAVLVAALGAALIQIGTNLYNDAADSRRGGDGFARVGPSRVTALGLIDGRRVASAAVLAFAAAATAGLYLVVVGGLPILALGVASIVCGLAYSGGPAPISYTPLGEVFVLLFFGVFAVVGTSWLASGSVGSASIVAGLALGLFAAAVLLVNNHRDRAEDARVGRRTLAILVGPERSRWIFAALMFAPFLLLYPLSRLLLQGQVWPAFLALPLVLLVVAKFWREPPGRGLNPVLALTAQTQVAFAGLLAAGLVA